MQEPNNIEIAPSNLSFESLKKLNEHGIEYWSARDLQPCLGYTEWRTFENTVKKAMKSCQQSGNNPKNHFTRADKMIKIGNRITREVNDYHLSRFACYLIVQNGDPRKPEIAHMQNNFAIQTRKRELSDLAGVQNNMFGTVLDAGYRGLYGGLGGDAIKARKDIDPKEELMDRMNSTERAAYQFCMTQTREKLKRENIKSQRDAMEVYEAVGKEVRAAIVKIGGALPENISPAAGPIKNVEKRLKSPKLQPSALLFHKKT